MLVKIFSKASTLYNKQWKRVKQWQKLTSQENNYYICSEKFFSLFYTFTSNDITKLLHVQTKMLPNKYDDKSLSF